MTLHASAPNTPSITTNTSSSWNWFSSGSSLPRTSISEANRLPNSLSERVVQLERQLVEEKLSRERSEMELRQYAEEIAYRCGVEVSMLSLVSTFHRHFYLFNLLFNIVE